MSQWKAMTVPADQMPVLADLVVKAEKLDYEDKLRLDRVLDFHRVQMAIYVAMERIHKAVIDPQDPKGKKTLVPSRIEVTALVISLRIEGHQVYWKAFHESMLPVSFMCPERILNVLTPTKSVNAIEWRLSCRQTLSGFWRKAGIRAGMLVVTDKPLPFAGSYEASIFRKEKDPDVYTALTAEGLKLFDCRIPRHGLIDSFTVWQSLEHYLANRFLKEIDDDTSAPDFMPWLPQEDDVHDAAQLSLFG